MTGSSLTRLAEQSRLWESLDRTERDALAFVWRVSPNVSCIEERHVLALATLTNLRLVTRPSHSGEVRVTTLGHDVILAGWAAR